MPREKYTDAESVTLLYFASRGLTHRSCAALIKHKSGGVDRTTTGIRKKLRSMKRLPRLRNANGQWVLNEVDTYIHSRGLPNLPELISFGPVEMDLISPVSPRAT
jgi:hypothetical protein